MCFLIAVIFKFGHRLNLGPLIGQASILLQRHTHGHSTMASHPQLLTTQDRTKFTSTFYFFLVKQLSNGASLAPTKFNKV